MKDFLKTFVASFLALILFFGSLVALGLALILTTLAAAKSRSAALTIEPGSFLVYDLNTSVSDVPVASDKEQSLRRIFSKDETPAISLRRLLDTIDAAAKDSRVGGILLKSTALDLSNPAGFATLREVRDALVEFKKSKKPVVAYLVEPFTRDYYLASVADEIYLNPSGMLTLPGLAAQPVFFGPALQRYGIGIQVARNGKYKSFVEPYISDRMSPANREQLQSLVDDLWRQFVGAVEESRHVPAADLQALVDNQTLIAPEVAQQKGLVTKLGYLSDVIDDLRRRAGPVDAGPDHTFRQVSLSAYADDRAGQAEEGRGGPGGAGGNESAPLAIVYAEGEIVDGDATGTGSVAGDTYARAIRRLRNNSAVKAIVLRVNSPGGSALASEVIQRELALAQKAGKTIVVSMGSVAASGGYLISTAADRVFAEPSTITGSIGVFALVPNVQKIANDHGVTFDQVGTGRHADLLGVARPKSDEELGIFQQMADRTYDEFLRQVADSRGLPLPRVREIAEGRVWSGAAAEKLGLVNEVGGLRRAVAFAREKAHLPAKTDVAEFPLPRDLGEQLLEAFSGEKRPRRLSALGEAVQAGQEWLGRGSDALPRRGALGQEFRRVADELRPLGEFNDPRHLYARLPFTFSVR